MKVNHTLVPYALAFVFAGWAYVQHLKNEDLALILQSSQSQPANHEALAMQLQDSLKTIEDLRDEVSSLRQQLTQSASNDVPAQTPQITTPADQEPIPTGRSFEERFGTPERREAWAQNTVTSDYGDFVNSLNLSIEDRQQLMTAMKAVLSRRMELQVRFNLGQISREQFALAIDDDMRRAIAQYLSLDQMAAFSEFEAGAQQRSRQQMIESMFNTQLTYLDSGAPGLTEANKQLVSQAWVDAQMNPADTNTTRVSISSLTLQIEESLQGKMNESQMQIVREFLDNMSKSQEAFR